MKMPLFLLVLVLSLAACASRIMEGYVGQDLTSVIGRYGPPMNVYDLPDGRRAFQWEINSTVLVPTTTNMSVVQSGWLTTGTAVTSGGGAFSNRCIYTLYAQPQGTNHWTIVGFERPRLGCE